jgi:hypothetical protein
MWQAVIKVLLTAIVVVAVSEIAKRGSLWAGLLASLPLTSLLAFVWLYLDTGDVARVAALSQSIAWLVLPSLVLLLLLPVLLRAGLGFWTSIALACAATVLAYYAMVRLLLRWGIAH